ncbi:ParA family protein [Cysteiniphilum marinum]|uniref:ParA family protein n=1 Tax=Cysteiniphilum marinum TaxID=2774191 RepID=UPI00193B6B3A|nr:ParA family protein [Cysteiniphilum marinum]
MKAKKIVFLNQKGGVGKTTIAHNTAYYLAEVIKQKTLLIDLDPQGNSSEIYIEDKDLEPSASSIFNQRAFDASRAIRNAMVKKRSLPNLDIIHSNKTISQALKEIPTRSFREKILSKSLTTIVDKYNYIIIDCPASIEDSVINAIYFGEQFIIPVEMGGFASSAIQDVLEIIAEVKEYDTLIDLLDSGIVTFVKNKVDKRGTRLNSMIDNEISSILPYSANSTIRHSLYISRATTELVPIFEFKDLPSGVKEDYKNYIEEVISC